LESDEDTVMDQTMTPACQRHHHRLSLICVNDVYSFCDKDASGTSTPRGGWSRAATLMKRLRQENSGCDATTLASSTVDSEEVESSSRTVLTVANGDLIGGSSLLQSCQGTVAVEVMNSIPIDLAVLGNHEFDYGDEVLMERVKESNFSWLGSNVYYPTNYDGSEAITPCNGTGQTINSLPPANHSFFPGIVGNGKIYTLPKNLKLGVFGLVTKLTPKISNPSPRVLFDDDILTVARKVTQSLRAQGAQIIVAITHMSEEEDRLLAADRMAGVDLILGGHEHEPLGVIVHRKDDEDDDANEMEDERHDEGGVLVFKCGMNAYWVGHVHLDIEYECDNSDTLSDNVNVISIGTSWSMHAVTSRIPEDANVSSIVDQSRKETDAKILVSCFGEEIASTLSLDDVVATIEAPFREANGNTKTLPLDTRMSSVRRKEATGGNMLADAMHWLLETNIHKRQKITGENLEPIPTLAMINGGFIRGDRLYQPGSEFTVRHIVKEVPFPRSMEVLQIKGKYLKMALAEQLKGCSRGPTGSFPHLSSNARLSYEIHTNTASSNDVSIPGNCNGDVIELHSFTVNNTGISDDKSYAIAVTGFVAEGNEACPSWLKATRLKNDAWSGVKISRVLLEYLQCHKRIVPVLEGRLELISPPKV